MTRRTARIGTVVLVVLMILVAGAMSATAASSDDRQSSAHAIVGSWDVALMLPGLPPGRVLATFTSDGGTVETANSAPALRGASHGAWERIDPNLFAVTRVFFRFNPQTGAYLGTTKVNATVRVARDGETFAAVSISELRDPDGNVVLAGVRGTAVGTRLRVEQIPDRP
jgi:hypothetical protein